MRCVGGLKLALEGAGRGDRRVRFAKVSLSGVDAEDELTLVTDSRGRMHYRLAVGPEEVVQLVEAGADQPCGEGRVSSRMKP